MASYTLSLIGKGKQWNVDDTEEHSGLGTGVYTTETTLHKENTKKRPHGEEHPPRNPKPRNFKSIALKSILRELRAYLTEKRIAPVDGIKIEFTFTAENMLTDIKIYYLELCIAKINVFRFDQAYTCFYLDDFFNSIHDKNTFRQSFKGALRANTDPTRSMVGYTMDIIICACQTAFDILAPEIDKIELALADVWDTKINSETINSDILKTEPNKRKEYIKYRTGDGKPFRFRNDDTLKLEQVSKRIESSGWYGMWGFEPDEFGEPHLIITHSQGGGGSKDASYISLNGSMAKRNPE